MTDTKSFPIDGYYKNQYADDTLYSHWVCFYADGTYLNCGTYLDSDTTVIRELLSYPKQLSKRGSWGAYSIVGDTIKIQEFYYSDNFILSPFLIHGRVHEITGVLLPPDKFIMLKLTDNKGTYTGNNVYNFYPCKNCKPDSTNWLKENKRLNKIDRKEKKYNPKN